MSRSTAIFERNRRVNFFVEQDNFCRIMGRDLRNLSYLYFMNGQPVNIVPGCCRQCGRPVKGRADLAGFAGRKENVQRTGEIPAAKGICAEIPYASFCFAEGWWIHVLLRLRLPADQERQGTDCEGVAGGAGRAIDSCLIVFQPSIWLRCRKGLEDFYPGSLYCRKQ